MKSKISSFVRASALAALLTAAETRAQSAVSSIETLSIPSGTPAISGGQTVRLPVGTQPLRESGTVTILIDLPPNKKIEGISIDYSEKSSDSSVESPSSQSTVIHVDEETIRKKVESDEAVKKALKDRQWIQHVVPTPDISGVPKEEVIKRAEASAPPELQPLMQDLVTAQAWISSRSRPMLVVQEGRLVGLEDFHPVCFDAAGAKLPDLRAELTAAETPVVQIAQSTVKFISVKSLPDSVEEITGLGSGLLVKSGYVLSVEHVARDISSAQAQGGTVYAELIAHPSRGNLPARLAVEKLRYNDQNEAEVPREKDFALIIVAPAEVADLSALVSVDDDIGASHDYRGLAVAGYPVPLVASAVEGNIATYFGDFFGGSPGTLRVSPGLTRFETTKACSHDAACMGGNSGGPIINLSSGKVVGLHVGGKATVTNRFITFKELNKKDRAFLDMAIAPAKPTPPIK